MTKLGIFVGEEKWTFFREIFECLYPQYKISVFEPKVNKFPLLYGRLNRWSYHRNISLLLQRNDVCFFEWTSDLLMHASQKPKYCGIVTRLHSFELYEWAPKINWEAVDKIILVSEAMRERFGELYPSQVHKTEVIYNGVCLDKYQYPEHQEFYFNLGMLCNILPIKRIYELVLVVASLKKKGLDPHLRIAGTPADDLRYFAAIKSLVVRLNLADNVIFDGYVNDTPAWLQNIDILISNSYWEGQPVSLIEGMASGCYCLSHHWKGAEEILPIDNLYLSEAELIGKIMAYVDSSTEEKEANRACMRAIAMERFDIEQTKQKIRAVIDGVVNN